MPLSTGALWPTLRPLGTAAAADMNSKYEWLEGHRYPHDNGNLTTGAYDIGSATYKWDKAVLGSIVLGGTTLGADVPGRTLDAWAYANVGSHTITASFNVSSVTLFFGGGGTDGGAAFLFTNTMSSNKYAVCSSGINRSYVLSLTTDYVRFVSRNAANYPTGSSRLSFMARQ